MRYVASRCMFLIAPAIVAMTLYGCSSGGTTGALPLTEMSIPRSADSTIQLPGSVPASDERLASLSSSSSSVNGSRSVPTIPAFSVYDSVGVNTHFSRNGERANYPGITRLLAGLGARHIREAINPNPDRRAMALQRSLFQQYAIDSTETTANHDTIPMWVAYKIGIGAAMTGLEGANEPDNHQSGNAWVRTTLALQKRVWSAVHGGSAALAGLEVEGPSILNCSSSNAYGDQSAYADFANMHRYFSGYAPETPGWGGSTCGTPATYGSLGYDVAVVQRVAKGRPIRTTETSYCTAPVHGCVPQSVAAEYEPRIFTTSSLYSGMGNSPIGRSYVYELVSENSTDSASSLGLTDQNFNPKPMYYAMQGFIARLRDVPGAASGNLAFSISGATTALRAVPLRYSNGDYGMILYDSSPVWAPNGSATSQGSPLAVPDVDVVFSVPGQTLNGLVSSTYDGSGHWRDSNPATSRQLALPVNGYMHILRWSSGAGAIPAPTPTPTPPSAPTPVPKSGVAIDAGGGAVGMWISDSGYSGGHIAASYSGTIDTSLVADPAPQEVYQTARAGSSGRPFSYTVRGLHPGSSHTVRLDFAENRQQDAGGRVFSVTLTGTSETLDDFDIVRRAGAPHKAIVIHFDNVAADSLGRIVVTFTPSVNDGYVNGIEVE